MVLLLAMLGVEWSLQFTGTIVWRFTALLYNSMQLNLIKSLILLYFMIFHVLPHFAAKSTIYRNTMKYRQKLFVSRPDNVWHWPWGHGLSVLRQVMGPLLDSFSSFLSERSRGEPGASLDSPAIKGKTRGDQQVKQNRFGSCFGKRKENPLGIATVVVKFQLFLVVFIINLLSFSESWKSE